MLGLVLAPLRGVLRVAELLADRVAEEMDNEETIRRKLVALRLQLEMEEIEAAEYAEQEAPLLARLREIRRERWAQWGGQDGGTPGIDR